MKQLLSFILSISIIFYFGCSSSTESTSEGENQNTEQEEIYVFDEVETVDDQEEQIEEPAEDEVISTEEQEIENNVSLKEFIVQVGAFTTRERAEIFLRENRPKLEWPIKISYSNKVNLYVVQLPPFSTRSQAEEIRNLLWKTPDFKDAFIVPDM
jgi:cell division protein FtsN